MTNNIRDTIILHKRNSFLFEIVEYFSHDPRPFWINAENFDFWNGNMEFFTTHNVEGGS